MEVRVLSVSGGGIGGMISTVGEVKGIDVEGRLTSMEIYG